MKFTKATVAALTMPAGKSDHTVWDSDLPGFGVRMRNDSMSWLIQYRIGRQQRRESLGDTRKVRLEDARRAAQQRFAQAQLGIDPVAVKAEAAMAALTFGAIADRFLAVKAEIYRPSTYKHAQRYLEQHWRPLRGRPIASVSRADVAALLHDLSQRHGRVAAARARDTLSSMFTWAMKEGITEVNPTTHTNTPDAGVKARDRVLSLTEIAAVWHACENDNFGRIIKLLILTACRRTEIGSLRWDEIDFDAGTITICAERSKNGRAHMLPLPEPALEILHSTPRYEATCLFGLNGFSAWSPATRNLRRRIVASGEKAGDFTLHDFRRSAITHMAEIGVQPHVLEALANHVSGFKRGVAGIYNRAAYQAEKAAALTLWAEHLLAAVEGQETRVVPLRRLAADRFA
jgi:integrase